MVSRERDTALSAISPRRGECQRGCRISRNEGPLQLQAASLNLLEDTRTFPRPYYRSIRISSDLPSPTLLQLEARRTSGSHGRLPPGLEGRDGIRQPSLEPRRMGPDEDGGAKGRSSASGAVVALPIVVRQDIESPCLSSSENPTREGDNGSSGGGAYPGNTPTPSRVAYLRQHYADKRISEEVT